MNAPSLSILLTTIGRESLIDMLNSIKDQLQENDYLYIAIDGKEHYEDVKRILKDFRDYKFNLNIIYQDTKLGYWGCGIRNKYQKDLKGDYILHADDDDVYLNGAIDMIRKFLVHSNSETLLFFKFFLNYSLKHAVWQIPQLVINNIGTPCGVIPNVPEKMGEWGYRYGGDFDFYNSCKFDYQFIDYPIYAIKPKLTGYMI